MGWVVGVRLESVEEATKVKANENYIKMTMTYRNTSSNTSSKLLVCGRFGVRSRVKRRGKSNRLVQHHLQKTYLPQSLPQTEKNSRNKVPN
jgi:hypothetical protein